MACNWFLPWVRWKKHQPSHPSSLSHFNIILSLMQGPGDGTANCYRLNRLGFKAWWTQGIFTFSIPIQTGLGTHPPSSTMGTVPLPPTSPTSISLIWISQSHMARTKTQTLHYTVFSIVVLTSIFLGSNIFLSNLLPGTLKPLDIMSKPTNTQLQQVLATHVAISREAHYELTDRSKYYRSIWINAHI